MNTYRFFENHSFSVGMSVVPDSEEGVEVDLIFQRTSMQYQKLVFEGDRLVGVSGINTGLDPGIMWQLIQRRIGLGKMKRRLAAFPLDTGRILMCRMWR